MNPANNRCCSFRMAVLLLFFLASAALFSQNPKITGVVVDENGESVIGASIIVKGTQNGTMTDVNGEFSLNAPEQSTLVITYIGYQPLEVRATSQKMQIAMNNRTTDLDEIVVVGFGTQKKVNLTGAVSTVDSKTFESRPVSSALQALQGAVPGLNISNTNGGRVDEKPTYNLRGMGTLTTGNDKLGSSGNPLVLIDGMEGDIYSVNPQDIENISFLKDAAASSIYGSRAPFGVILITTKKGKQGKAKISYDGNFRSSSPLNIPDIVDSYTFARVFNAVPGGQMTFSDDLLQRIKDFQDGKIPMTYNEVTGKYNPTTAVVDPNDPYSRWVGAFDGVYGSNDNINVFKELYKSSSFSQEHNITVSGGTERVSYYLSGNIMDDSGMLKIGDDSQGRVGMTAKINGKINDKVSLSYIGKFIRSRYERPESNAGWNAYTLSHGWPTMPVYDPNGYLFGTGSKTSSMFLEIANSGSINNMEDRVYQQFNATVEPIKDWKIFGNFNFSLKENFQQTTRLQMYYYNALGELLDQDKNSFLIESMDRTNYYNTNVYSEYLKSFTSGHSFKIMAGFQSEMFNLRNLSIQKWGILNSENPSINSSSGLDQDGNVTPSSVGGGYAKWSSAGYFGRLNYDYKERYLIEGNLRYDGTSRFRSDKRWNWLPSVSIGWNIAREAFWENLTQYVGNFKLRGSFGILGNQNTNNVYPTYSSLRLGTLSSSWLVNGSKQNTAEYPNLVSQTLTWEKIKTYNAGVDLSFLSNRLTASFDYFVRYTNDMVGPAVALPAVYGVPLSEIPQTNNTDLKTAGFELELAWRDHLANGLNYSVRFVLSDDQTTILEYPNPSKTIGYKADKNAAWNGHVVYNQYIPGEKWGNIWGYTTVGIAKTQEEMDAHLATLPNGGQKYFESGSENNWGAGDIMYADLNGDDKVDAGANTLDDPGDRSVIGNITPRFKFGLDLGADWKGFDLRIFFQGVMKRDYMNTSYLFWGLGRSLWDNSMILTQHMDYFRDDPDDPFGLNLDAYYPRLTSPNDANATYHGKNRHDQTRYLQNAAYIRLKNLTLGYTLPETWLSKAGFQKVRIYVSGENLWTGTKLAKMFDPETIDYNGVLAYPLSKVYSAGISVTF